jgi:hypothetical protein
MSHGRSFAKERSMAERCPIEDGASRKCPGNIFSEGQGCSVGKVARVRIAFMGNPGKMMVNRSRFCFYFV